MHKITSPKRNQKDPSRREKISKWLKRMRSSSSGQDAVFFGKLGPITFSFLLKKMCTGLIRVHLICTSC